MSDFSCPLNSCHKLGCHEDGEAQDECEEMFVVSSPNAASDPWTVVIESLHAIVTITTVMSPVGSHYQTLLTKTVRHHMTTKPERELGLSEFE